MTKKKQDPMNPIFRLFKAKLAEYTNEVLAQLKKDIARDGGYAIANEASAESVLAVVLMQIDMHLQDCSGESS